MARDIEPGHPPYLGGRSVHETTLDVGHAAAALAADVLVVVAARFEALPAVAQIDTMRRAVPLQRHDRPEDARGVRVAPPAPDLLDELLDQPGAGVASQEVANRVPNRAAPGHEPTLAESWSLYNLVAQSDGAAARGVS
jgi:hypothetical protein